MGLRASVSPARAFTKKMPIMEAMSPIPMTATGNTRPLAAMPSAPMAFSDDTPRMMEAMSTTA